jgi:hypothetical protein
MFWSRSSGIFTEALTEISFGNIKYSRFNTKNSIENKAAQLV